MRKLVFLGALLLAACATNPPATPPETVEGGPLPPTPVHGVTPGHKCDAAGTDRFVGLPGTSETGSAIMQATRAAVLRWAPIGYMLTMDYREDRVTARLGADRRITAINCG